MTTVLIIYTIGGMDPLPWKKMRKTAEKNNWTIEDWQHVLEDEQSDSGSDSDPEWVPPSEEEDSSEEEDDEKEDEEEEEPSAKRRKH